MSTRRVKQVYRSLPTIEGAGVRLQRAFGSNQSPQFDPFLLLDEFHSTDPRDYLPGFPSHPHRGIETVTYLLEGLVEHEDSLGNKGSIGAGEVQWMTAGSGIIHQEMPQRTASGLMWGFQVWVNLPAAQKMMPPRYRGLRRTDIPVAELASGVKAKVICGVLGGVQGPIGGIVTDPEFFDVIVPAGTAFIHEVKPDYTALAYVLSGRGHFEECPAMAESDTETDQHGEARVQTPCEPENVILYERQGGTVVVKPADEPVRFLFLSGRPLGEPVAWYGPVVMNSEEELHTAFRELQNGTFVKHATVR